MKRFTYFFHNPATGLTKIGKTKNPLARFKVIKAKETGALECVCLLKGDLELNLHAKYQEFRVVGEWFKLDQTMIDSIVSMEGNVISLGLDSFPSPPPKTGIAAIQIDARSHERLKKQANAKGRLVGHLAAELINRALDAEKNQPK